MGVISNGTTLLDSGSLSSGLTGAMTLIKTLTASSSANLSFVHGTSSVVLDSTYKEYVFKFIDIHPATNSAGFRFNLSVDTGGNYNVTKTTTVIQSYQDESGSTTALQYDTGMDLAQSTNPQFIAENIGNGNDESVSGFLHLFNPADTNFVKHFLISSASYFQGDYTNNYYVGGYGNTTSAVDGVQFSMNSGNIDSGTIKLYGIK